MNKAERSEMGRRNTKQGQRIEYKFVGKLRKLPFFKSKDKKNQKVKRTAAGQKRGDWPDITAVDISGVAWSAESKKVKRFYSMFTKYLPTHDFLLMHEEGHESEDVVSMKWSTFKRILYLAYKGLQIEMEEMAAKETNYRPELAGPRHDTLGSTHGG